MMTISTLAREQNGREATVGIARELAELRGLTVGQLCEKYREVFGVPTHSRNKDYLFKKIAWRIQELAEGGLSERALAKIDELAPDTPVRWRPVRDPNAFSLRDIGNRADNRDPRLPPSGTMLTRMYKGHAHKVTVLEDGFEYLGEKHNSLSIIAGLITGTNWNGYLFWGLKNRRRQKAPAEMENA
jgi:hypothetical protein